MTGFNTIFYQLVVAYHAAILSQSLRSVKKNSLKLITMSTVSAEFRPISSPARVNDTRQRTAMTTELAALKGFGNDRRRLTN